MDYRKVLVHGETDGQLDDDNRYLEVKAEAGSVVLHLEDDEGYTEISLEASEALAMIAALTEAVANLL